MTDNFNLKKIDNFNVKKFDTFNVKKIDNFNVKEIDNFNVKFFCVIKTKKELFFVGNIDPNKK